MESSFNHPTARKLLTDGAMARLAGDNMTVRAIGLILLCVLCYTERVDARALTPGGEKDPSDLPTFVLPPADVDLATFLDRRPRVTQVLQIARYSGWPSKSTKAWDCLPDDEGESYRIQKKNAQALCPVSSCC